MMSERISYTAETVRELEELIALGERSAQLIDAMSESIGQKKIGIMIQGAVIYLAIATSSWFLFEIPQLRAYLDVGKSSAFPAVFLIAILSLCLIFWFALKFKLLNSLQRDMDFEKKVLQRVVSLISEQLRRVSDRHELSALALATYEIRVIRLDRSNRPRRGGLINILSSLLR